MNSWNTFWLLRPLIVFAIACPTFIVVALLGLRKNRPEAEGRSKAQTDQSAPFVRSSSDTWRFDQDTLTESGLADETESPIERRAA